MYIHVCDICRTNAVDVKIKYKYKAERLTRFLFHPLDWEEIEVCQECLDKIIKAKNEECIND